MKASYILSALGLTVAISTGAALASDHGGERHREGRAESSRSHDEKAEHASRRDGRRHHEEREHQSDDSDRNDDRVGERGKRRPRSTS